MQGMIASTTTPVALSPTRLALIVASRLVLNTVFRVTYPLTQFVLVRTGVGVQAAAGLVTVQVLAGLLSPVSGYLGDRYGYRRTMTAGLALATIGTALVALTLNFTLLLVAFGIAGLGTALYNPAMQAYVSSLTPLAQRGRALGAVELSWSLAGIFGVPLLALLVDRTQSLTLAFALLAGLLALMCVALFQLPPDHRTTRTTAVAPPSVRELVRQPVVMALFAFLFLVLCGSETLFIAQAPWLRERFGADPVAIAQSLFVFGLGELVGVSFAMVFTDRLGLRRAPLIGFGGAALAYLALPWLSQNWIGYLAAFALFALVFEFAIVSSFSLVSAVYPPARGMVLAASGTAIQIGRTTGSQIGPAILLSSGIVANSVVAALLTVLGCAVVVYRVFPQEARAVVSESS